MRSNILENCMLNIGYWILAAVAMAAPLTLTAASRFPQPEFDSGYVAHKMPHPAPDFAVTPMMDILILVVALCIAVVLVRKVRSRNWILFFGLICLGWFGFIRNGCFCPIGTIQNVALSLFTGVRLPLVMGLFFAVPLIFSLLSGRVFCSVICPLGALQELFIVKPLRMPKSLDATLRIIPLIVLSVGIVCAVNGAGFIICRTDPFVGIFRQSAALPMLLTGMGVLLVGTVVARPYCRYFCPYGVLLEICSLISWKQVELTSNECINCRLCVGMCPVDAIEAPRPALSDKVRGRQFKQFLYLLVFLPIIILAGAGVGHLAGAGVAQLHPGVMLVEKWQSVEEHDEDLFPSIEAFKRSGGTIEQAKMQAAEIVGRFREGCMYSGVFIGLILGLRLLVLSKLQGRKVHQASRSRCVACGRCFSVCPNK
ncbi:MAG: 4Fe-4S binding protein [Kiritimatiellae bacterium]|jgi:NosR/NirI family nitrous oxide reductase transcriptional regulator|nr:4Fe-4S binding protein [Kiritimatiellia bacterium]